MKTALRHLAIAAVLLALWQALILATGPPNTSAGRRLPSCKKT